MTMQRLPNWRKRFETFIDQVKATPFAWGRFDCGPAFAGGIVEALTGADLVATYRGRYTTAAGALRVIRNEGFTDLSALVDALLPAHEHPSQMRLGDVVGVNTMDAFGVALGICNGGGTIFVLRPDGIGVLDQGEAARAWRVG